jgi:hypothetical protein
MDSKTPLTDALLSSDGGHAVMQGDELVVYNRYPDGSLTEVWRGDLFRALQIVFLGPPGHDPRY